MQHKIPVNIINFMNGFIWRQVEIAVLKSGADDQNHFTELSCGHLTSNKIPLGGKGGGHLWSN